MISRKVNQLEVLSCEPKRRKHETPLLFVHGAFAGAWVWDEHFLPWFAEQGFSAHALSLRGHGDSAGHENIDWHSVHDYVDDLTEVIADLGTAPVLVGQRRSAPHQSPARPGAGGTNRLTGPTGPAPVCCCWPLPLFWCGLPPSLPCCWP